MRLADQQGLRQRGQRRASAKVQSVPLHCSPMTDFLETDAYALFAPAERRTRLFLTCEHASNRLPEPYEWTPRDLESGITETHWAVDIGAETLTKELSHMLGARGIAARFCRLFCDANRAIGEETMFRASAENGQIVLDLNMDISESEKEYRVSKYYTPYHSTISAYVDSPAEPIDFVFSVHSFTPLYEGQKRVVEVGVLYRDEIDETVALKVSRREERGSASLRRWIFVRCLSLSLGRLKGAIDLGLGSARWPSRLLNASHI